MIVICNYIIKEKLIEIVIRNKNKTNKFSPTIYLITVVKRVGVERTVTNVIRTRDVSTGHAKNPGNVIVTRVGVVYSVTKT